MSDTEQRDRIMKLYNGDWSLNAMAAQTGLTRNKIAGIIHRAKKAGAKVTRTKGGVANFGHGAPARIIGKGPATKPPVVAPAPTPQPPQPKPQPKPAPAAPMLDFIGGVCRYPIGDPRAEGFRFCNAKRKTGSPYCEKHHAGCYQPAHKPAEPIHEEAPHGRFTAR